jgi:hypothetical protein
MQNLFIKPYLNFTKNKKYPYIYDISLTSIQNLSKYSSIESHIVLYPYSRKIKADNFHFYPFEEYAENVLEDKRSIYSKISYGFSKTFGLILAILISIIFYVFNSGDLFTVQSIVSVFAAYAIGKDIWEDIDRFLVQNTRGHHISYSEKTYTYELEKESTLSRYSDLAKKRRYQKDSMLPAQMDLVQTSNAETIRMKYTNKELKRNNEDEKHILSIHVDESLVDAFDKEGYLLGIKLSLNKSFFGFNSCREIFQSFDNKELGALDIYGKWHKTSVLYRRVFRLGRIRLYLKNKIIENKSIISK